ncbi:unnamed protein product [Cuscuta campestris]|uniref:Glutaredoxin domain-containing protein n=1 Tax=Cuscuta campestris TaxID=132261 RepID=A0A484N790_9ASTE|nr:unnamed protein product [Cuscuta campestris]
MGCANSKKAVCVNCHAPYSPVRRSVEWDRPPRREAESYYHHRHVVSLTSSTFGSLLLDPLDPNQNLVYEDEEGGEEFSNGKMIPAMSPGAGEPETINAWELMKDLEDCNHADHSFSSPVSPNQWSDSNSTSGSNDTSVELASEFDPQVLESFRKALSDLPPACTPLHLSPPATDNQETGEATPGRRRNRVIFYFTSLRGVRKTYEDCCHVRSILQELGVRVDDRDVSLHSGFKEELKELLGESYRLPGVFVGEKYIGGAEEIRRMHEEGKLEKLLERCERVEEGGGGEDGGTAGGCEACGDIRFVPCDTCSGSCKIYCQAGSDSDGFGFQRCTDCNENGLIRCPICCD